MVGISWKEKHGYKCLCLKGSPLPGDGVWVWPHLGVYSGPTLFREEISVATVEEDMADKGRSRILRSQPEQHLRLPQRVEIPREKLNLRPEG